MKSLSKVFYQDQICFEEKLDFYLMHYNVAGSIDNIAVKVSWLVPEMGGLI